MWFVLAGIGALVLGAALLQGAVLQEFLLGPLFARFAMRRAPHAMDQVVPAIGMMLAICGIVLIGAAVAGVGAQTATAAFPGSPSVTGPDTPTALESPASPPSSPAGTPSPSPSTVLTPASTTSRTAEGPWAVQGSGVAVTIESVTVQSEPSQPGAYQLTLPVDVISDSDLSDFVPTVLDQAGDNLDPNPTFPPNQWNTSPQAGIRTRSMLVFDTDPAYPAPTSLTLTFKDFFWASGQRLKIEVPVPRLH